MHDDPTDTSKMSSPSCSPDPVNNTHTNPKKKELSGSRNEKKLVNSWEMLCSVRRFFCAFHVIDDIGSEYISQSDFRIRDSLLVGLV